MSKRVSIKFYGPEIDAIHKFHRDVTEQIEEAKTFSLEQLIKNCVLKCVRDAYTPAPETANASGQTVAESVTQDGSAGDSGDSLADEAPASAT